MTCQAITGIQYIDENVWKSPGADNGMSLSYLSSHNFAANSVFPAYLQCSSTASHLKCQVFSSSTSQTAFTKFLDLLPFSSAHKFLFLCQNVVNNGKSTKLTTTTLFDASRTWIVGPWYCGASFTAVCVLHVTYDIIRY